MMDKLFYCNCSDMTDSFWCRTVRQTLHIAPINAEKLRKSFLVTALHHFSQTFDSWTEVELNFESFSPQDSQQSGNLLLH